MEREAITRKEEVSHIKESSSVSDVVEKAEKIFQLQSELRRLEKEISPRILFNYKRIARDNNIISTMNYVRRSDEGNIEALIRSCGWERIAIPLALRMTRSRLFPNSRHSEDLLAEPLTDNEIEKIQVHTNFATCDEVLNKIGFESFINTEGRWNKKIVEDRENYPTECLYFALSCVMATYEFLSETPEALSFFYDFFQDAGTFIKSYSDLSIVMKIHLMMKVFPQSGKWASEESLLACDLMGLTFEEKMPKEIPPPLQVDEMPDVSDSTAKDILEEGVEWIFDGNNYFLDKKDLDTIRQGNESVRFILAAIGFMDEVTHNTGNVDWDILCELKEKLNDAGYSPWEACLFYGCVEFIENNFRGVSEKGRAFITNLFTPITVACENSDETVRRVSNLFSTDREAMSFLSQIGVRVWK